MSFIKGLVDGISAVASTTSVLLKQSATSYTDLQTADSKDTLVTNDGTLLTILEIDGVIGLVGEDDTIHLEQLFYNYVVIKILQILLKIK